MALTAEERAERAERRRSEILAASTRVFARKGYHATNVADIAAELSIGHGTVYRYYRNKLDVFRAVIASAIDRVSAVVAAEAPDRAEDLASYRGQLRRIGERLFDLFVAEEDLARLIFAEAAGSDPAVERIVEGALDLFGNVTRQYLDHGVERGFVRPDLDREVAAFALNAMVLEGARRVLRTADRKAAKGRWIDTVAALVTSGVGAAP